MVKTPIRGMRYWRVCIETISQGDFIVLNPSIISRKEGETLAMNLANAANIKVWALSVTSRQGKAYRS